MKASIPLKKEKSLVNAILERPQEGRRRSRWRPPSGNRRREDEEEITKKNISHFQYILYRF